MSLIDKEYLTSGISFLIIGVVLFLYSNNFLVALPLLVMGSIYVGIVGAFNLGKTKWKV